MRLATLRSHLETALAGRVPSPFTYRDRKIVETVPAGIPEIDSLAGGLPRGSLTEICGPPCSGCTTLLLSALAARTAQSEVCALIDGRDAFDPYSAEAAGVKLKNLLWVRCRNVDQSLRATDLLLQGGGFGMVVSGSERYSRGNCALCSAQCLVSFSAHRGKYRRRFCFCLHGNRTQKPAPPWFCGWARIPFIGKPTWEADDPRQHPLRFFARWLSGSSGGSALSRGTGQSIFAARLRSGSMCSMAQNELSNKLAHEAFSKQKRLGATPAAARQPNQSRNRRSKLHCRQLFDSKSGSHGVCRDSHSGFSSAGGGSRRTCTARRRDCARGWNAAVVECIAANEAASRIGIELGMARTLAEQFETVQIRPRSRAQEKAAHAALLDLGWSISPRVEDTAPDTIVIDLAGLSSLFGSEESIAGQLAQRATAH